MSWEDQGRQEHGWFGNGTAPPKAGAGESTGGSEAEPRHSHATKGADVAAARAYLWARRYGPVLFGLPRRGVELDAFADAVMRIERAKPGTLARALGSDMLVPVSSAQGVQAATGEGAPEPERATMPRSQSAALAASAATSAPAAEVGVGLSAAARGAAKILGRAAGALLGGAAGAVAAPAIGIVTALYPNRVGDGTLTGHGMPVGGYPFPPGTGDTVAASSGEPPTSGRRTATPRSSGADAASLPPGGPDGPDEDWLKNQRYKDADHHGRTAQAGPRGVKSPAPRNGAAALRNSFRVSGNSPRRIGVDVANKEFVVLNRTSEGLWHGHVRSWKDLDQAMRNILIRNGVVSPRGGIIAQ